MPTKMPRINNQEYWAVGLRKGVSKLAKGWTVEEARGNVRLVIRVPDTPKQSVVLPFAWNELAADDAYIRVRNIFVTMREEGRDLKTAAQITSGDAPKLQTEHDWRGAIDRFKIQKTKHGKTVKEVTWAKKYEPVVTDAVDLLEKGKASNPETLIDLCIRNWEAGSRTRQERARNLVQFLKHCVYREKFPVAWIPTTELKDHIGEKKTDSVSNAGDPITDQQIINLINSFPDTDNANKWADAVRLMSELGLRPIELNFLSVKTDRKTGKPYWWCSYQKRSGGGTTKPRQVHPLPLVDDQGEVQQWNLMKRWQAKMIPLPSCEKQNALKDFLRKQPYWNSLKEELKANDENLKPYSLRHSYSLRGHQRNIDGGSMASSMGHSYECHCREYSWASKEGTESAFEKANKTLAMAA